MKIGLAKIVEFLVLTDRSIRGKLIIELLLRINRIKISSLPNLHVFLGQNNLQKRVSNHEYHHRSVVTHLSTRLIP